MKAKTLLLTVALLSLQWQASADVLVDRGLPTSNLNNSAGANRSNVGWLFSQYTSADYWLVGDTFQNTSSHTWNITSIRMWSFKPVSNVSIWGALAGSLSFGAPTIGTITAGAQYANGQTYQVPNGNFKEIYQLDFQVNFSLLPGQTYNFFLDGTGNGNYEIPFAHASNKDLSGTPQDGSDDSMLYAEVVGGNLDTTTIGDWSSKGNGWDKPSDVNVQVFGTVPDAGSTLMLLGTTLAGLGLIRRRMA